MPTSGDEKDQVPHLSKYPSQAVTAAVCEEEMGPSDEKGLARPRREMLGDGKHTVTVSVQDLFIIAMLLVIM